MRRKSKKVKSKINEQLLEAIIVTKLEWQKTQTFITKSIEPQEELLYQESLLRAKYLFLLRQARDRGLKAVSFH